MKIYSAPLSMFGAKVQIAALEKGIDFKLEMVPFDRDDRYRPKHPEVLRINPKGQVPVLVDGDIELFDSTQIFEYLQDKAPTPALWPQDVAGRARARKLEHLSDEVFFPHVIELFGLQEAMDSDAAQAACAGCARFYVELEQRLAALDRVDHLTGPYGFADMRSTWHRSSPSAKARR